MQINFGGRSHESAYTYTGASNQSAQAHKHQPTEAMEIDAAEPATDTFVPRQQHRLQISTHDRAIQ